jgi:hypothetical protein
MDGGSFMQRILLAGAPIILLALLSAPGTSRGDDTPVNGVYPPHATVDGFTLGEWSGRWHQWLYWLPEDRNPGRDETGEHCHEGQSGPVFFLAGTFGGTRHRTCAIPAGKKLFVPLITQAWAVTDPGETCELAIAGAEGLMDPRPENPDGVSSLTCKVDGVEVPDPWSHREASPCFPLCLPEDNVAGIPPGVYPWAANGYWMMLAPPPPGSFTIEFSASQGPPEDPSFSIDIQYDITIVEEAPRPAFFRGDASADTQVNLSDAVAILGVLFLGADPPRCEDAADTNDDGTMNITDAIYLLDHLFRGGCFLPPPSADLCGEDPTPDDLPECAGRC